MANPSISVPDELLEEFDRTIIELKYKDELPQNISRSEIIQDLMREWVEENSESKGNRQAVAQAAD